MISYTCCTIGLEEIEWNKSLNFHNGLVDSITICVQLNPAKIEDRTRSGVSVSQYYMSQLAVFHIPL